MINPNHYDRTIARSSEDYDDVVPSGPWEFDAEVAAKFENMLARSIPALSSLRSLVPLVVSSALAPGKTLRGSYVLDVGTSRGDAVAPFATAGANVYAIETSTPMYEAAKTRFAEMPNVTVVNDDALGHARRAANDRDLGPQIRYDVILCVLTLQFVPIEKRPAFLGDLFRITNPNGVIVLVEKIVEPSPFADRVTTTAYHRYKESTGYSREQIETKAKSLEGVLVPATPEANREFLRSAGYADVFSFYRALGFEGLVARNSPSW